VSHRYSLDSLKKRQISWPLWELNRIEPQFFGYTAGRLFTVPSMPSLHLADSAMNNHMYCYVPLVSVVTCLLTCKYFPVSVPHLETWLGTML
jgi:hypothetical protein